MGQLTERPPRLRVALTGNVALELIASYFREAGYDVHGPDSPPLDAFRPDFVYDVTSHDAVLSEEVPGFFDDRIAKLSGCPYSIDNVLRIAEVIVTLAIDLPENGKTLTKPIVLWRAVVPGWDSLPSYRF